MARRGPAAGLSDQRLRGSHPQHPTRRQLEVLAAYVEAGGSVPSAAARAGIRPSTAKHHLADLRARSGLTTEQLIYVGRAAQLRDRGADVGGTALDSDRQGGEGRPIDDVRHGALDVDREHVIDDPAVWADIAWHELEDGVAA